MTRAQQLLRSLAPSSSSRALSLAAPRAARLPAATIAGSRRGPPLTAPHKLQIRHYATPADKLGRTALHELHVARGGKMVEFGGYSMPLQYSDMSALASHKHVRTEAGLFDVGHMVQHTFRGAGAGDFLQWLTPGSIKALPPFTSTLSILLNEEGGILDDTVITKQADEVYYVVTNAGCREQDLAWFEKKLQEWKSQGKGEVQHEVMNDHGLVALQGPKAAEALAKHTDADLAGLYFGQSVFATVAGVADCHIARGGYTGEDGFEISIPGAEVTVKVTEALLSTDPVKPAGLAARDSLRLEAGMCLYGHDLDTSVSPIEGALAWCVSKDRRAAADFLGAERVLREIKEGPPRRRVGFLVEGPPAREGSPIHSEDGSEVIGEYSMGLHLLATQAQQTG